MSKPRRQPFQQLHGELMAAWVAYPTRDLLVTIRGIEALQVWLCGLCPPVINETGGLQTYQVPDHVRGGVCDPTDDPLIGGARQVIVDWCHGYPREEP